MPDSTPQEIEFHVSPAARGERLDAWLAAQAEHVSRSRIQALIRAGQARVDGLPAKSNHRLAGGETVLVRIPPLEDAVPKPEAIPIDVVYEDEWLIVVNKPAGLVVHPAPGHSSGTLVNALLGHCADLSGIGGERRPGIVHRLDQDTSGLIVAAKSDAAHHALSSALARREMTRRYIAVVMGRPKQSSGCVEAPIARSRVDPLKMTIDPKRGREAITHWEIEKWGPGMAVVRCRLETGRTHQIRVHLASIGLPVAGDPLYGIDKRRELDMIPHRESQLIQALSRIDRQMLHAAELILPHPRDGSMMSFQAPPPPDMQTLLDAIHPLQMREEYERTHPSFQP